MARAVYMQANTVRDNVLQLIHGRSPSHRYLPRVWIEGAIQLTIGKVGLYYALHAWRPYANLDDT